MTRPTSPLALLVLLPVILSACDRCGEFPAPCPTARTAVRTSDAYTPSVESRRIADFEVCERMTDSVAPDTRCTELQHKCVAVDDRLGLVARIDYRTRDSWAAFSIELPPGTDFSEYDTITLFVKRCGDGAPIAPRLEVKAADKKRIGIFNVTGLTDAWQQIAIPLADLHAADPKLPVCSWTDMSEVTFTFQYDKVGEAGTVFLDDIYLERREGGAPPFGPECAEFNTATPVPTPTLTATPTEPPTATGTPEPTGIPTPTPIVVADFRGCNNTAAGGGLMGSFGDHPNIMVPAYAQDSTGGCFLRLDYNVSTFAGFFIPLPDVIVRPRSRLRFSVRGDPGVAAPSQVKVELHQAARDDKAVSSVARFDSITASWQRKEIGLATFAPEAWTTPVDFSAGLTELVFTVESAGLTHPAGGFCLDNIVFVP